MRRSNKVFSAGERRIAVYAVVAVVAVVALMVATGGIFDPSVGTGGRANYGFAELPGVMDAQPLS